MRYASSQNESLLRSIRTSTPCVGPLLVFGCVEMTDLDASKISHEML